MPTPTERLAQCREGREPALVATLSVGHLVLAPGQYLRGYCLLLADPQVDQLATLPEPDQAEFLAVMARVGSVIRTVTGAVRMNYGIYGNLDPFLHAHLWPRFADEAEALRTLPPLSFPAEVREAASVRFSLEAHGPLMEALRAGLRERNIVRS
ncbi:MAG: hypothetical protein SFX74_06325 [Fimbriimonadaceae bacterium]|nr:hypothetical protein [Fimbriimonadaceae bacterium]